MAGGSAGGARRPAAAARLHSALLPPAEDDSDESFRADEEGEESSDASSSEEAVTRTRSGRRSSAGVGAGATKALHALRATRAARASRQRDAFASSGDDDDAPVGKPAAAARRPAARKPAARSSSDDDDKPQALAAPPSSEAESSEEDEAEVEWQRRHAATAQRSGRADYQYRKHVTGLRLERLSDDDAADDDLDDFIASDEEEEEESTSGSGSEREASPEPAPRAPKGVVRRVRAAVAAAPPPPPPPPVAAAALEDSDVEAAPAAALEDSDVDAAPAAAPHARRRSRVIASEDDDDDDDDDDDVPIAALKRKAKAPAVPSSSDDDAPAATPGSARKRLRRGASPAAEAHAASPSPPARAPSQRQSQAQRREPNARQARVQDALTRLTDLRGKQRGERRIEAQMRAAGALGGGGASSSGGGSSSEEDEDAALFFIAASDEEGDGARGGEGGDAAEDDGAVACVCGATNADDEGFWIQCCNGMCGVWQHAACVGLGSREEAERATFFCARCKPAADAMLAEAAAVPAAGFAPLAGVGAELTPAEAEGRAWRAMHGARDVGAALAAALAADAAAPLKALLQHGRPGALRLALTHAQGRPLLPRAAEAGAVGCVRMLLRASAPQLPAKLLGTPVAGFCAALEAAKPAVAKAFMQEVPGLLALAARAGAYEEGGTAVHAAAAGGSLECLQLVLPTGAASALGAATVADSEGATPLMLAAAAPGGEPVVTHLLSMLLASARKEVSRLDAGGRNACHYAAGAGQAESVTMLLTAFPSMMHSQDSHGSSPLHVATAEGRGAAIRALLLRGASVTSKDHAGWVPLMYVRCHGVSIDTEGTLALLTHQPELQLAAMASLMADARSEARVLKILRALAETPAFFAVLNAFLRTRIGLLSGSLSFLLRRPMLLDAANKRRWFRTQVAAFWRTLPSAALEASEEDETAAEGADVLWVARDSAFQDWAAWALRRGPAVLRRREMWHALRLVDAPASMGSGVERDTLEHMAAGLARSGLLAPTAEGGRALAPPPGALPAAMRVSLVALGWLFGYCLLHERTLPLPLEGPFLRSLLGRRAPATLADLEAVDPVYHRSISCVLEAEGAGDLGLTFSVEEGGRTVELVPGGAGMAVTDANKAEFAAAVADWKLRGRCAEGTAAVREGLAEVLPPELLRVFHEGDLALMLGGATELDLADWRAHALYDGFDPKEPLVTWFWRVVAAMSQEERALMLKLATGSSRAPPGGFAALHGLTGPQRFTLMRVDADLDRLPTASTCFNVLKMPRYTSEAALERKLLAAVRFGAGGFEFV